ncbi:hypothetical protein [Flammeovirga pacifica]|uniref:Lipocalin-like domain-containing protein n=1 Tax=Flammeovirga pacifica TaxID=915059 RepID=A0A1S1Z393_FLAPC|nr:hypothetical protein [Flammeovirga pacifica]OHX67711.1 hypothetical protein NH26_15835 [Flammeovirga pacifica]
MKNLKYLSQLLFILTICFFTSCENTDIANTANLVAGNYRIQNISAKTNQGQADININPETDQIIITATDERTVKIDIVVTTARVSVGTSNANLLQSTYHDIKVEGNSENETFTLSKAINTQNNASLIGMINSNGELTLEYNISGTELFSLKAFRP